VSVPYLLAILIPVAAVLILVLAAVRLWRAAVRLFRVRGWLVDYANDRAGMLRARTAAVRVAVREVRAGGLVRLVRAGRPRTM
jgi:hypothetical protein